METVADLANDSLYFPGLATMQPTQADEFESDLGVVKEGMSQERLPIGRSDVTSALVTTLTPSSEISQIPPHTYKSLRPDTETVDFLQVVDPSGLKQFLTPSFPLHRNSRGWGPTVPGKRRTA